jgi:hypothetical protein
MLKYAKIINKETKQCEVGIGTNTEFYKSIGMTEMEVEQAYNGQWYLAGYAPKKVATKAELTAFVSAEADKVAYGGITVIADGERYLFKTDTDNIARCGAVMPAYDVMSDEQVIPWEVWKDDLIYMLPVSKVQFKNSYLFGVQMTIEVQNIKGTVCAEIKNLTDEQLSDEIFITTFKENVINQLNSVNTKFELN